MRGSEGILTKNGGMPGMLAQEGGIDIIPVKRMAVAVKKLQNWFIKSASGWNLQYEGIGAQVVPGRPFCGWHLRI